MGRRGGAEKSLLTSMTFRENGSCFPFVFHVSTQACLGATSDLEPPGKGTLGQAGIEQTTMINFGNCLIRMQAGANGGVVRKTSPHVSVVSDLSHSDSSIGF